MYHKKLKPFPTDFLWGASTSVYQVEEANLTDGKGPSCQDVKKNTGGNLRAGCLRRSVSPLQRGYSADGGDGISLPPTERIWIRKKKE